MAGLGAASFDLSCSADIVGLHARYTKILGLEISRQPRQRQPVEKIADYHAYPLGAIENIYNSYYRNWTFRFTGAGNNSRQMTIRWTIHDPKCSDSGIYRCLVKYKNETGVATLIGQQNLTARATVRNVRTLVTPYRRKYEYQKMDLVSVTCSFDFEKENRDVNYKIFVKFENDTEIEIANVTLRAPGKVELLETKNPTRLTDLHYVRVGRPVVINCSADSVGFPYNQRLVDRLVILRLLVGDTRNETQVIARYALSPYHENIWFTTFGGQRKWDFLFVEHKNFKKEGNPSPLAILWSMKDPKMEDAGLYECRVVYTRMGVQQNLRGQQYIDPRGEVRKPRVTVTPETWNGVYVEGELLQLTCTVVGPPYLRLMWRHGLSDSGRFESYRKPEDISVEYPYPVPNDDTGSMRYRNTLSLKVQEKV
ncbi:hypothetical protein ElyMa_002850400 [Elysia marginata]|uniref:Ig-like domain-containing protein n=1 Tax=Elysia marginata TaxID=1093978 RepID=A0AAV4HW58_9GAST|nr:hypothetical protein ElyMa_002850400 [Elysia marginata]